MRVLTNAKHSCSCDIAPSAWVARFAPLIRPGGRVLDLAAGGGRHARHLLGLGYRVVAVDRDIAALGDLARNNAREVCAVDLEEAGSWTLGGGYDGIVVTNYLHRPLFAALAAALAPGGILVYETFARGNERFGKPSNPDYLLLPGELLRAYPALTPVAFEQGIVERPRPAALQRLAAINDSESRLP